MRANLKKSYLIGLLLLFSLAVPLLQSLLFSTKTEGAIKIDKEIKADFLLSKKKYLLVYFGYVGCSDVCTPFLQKLSQLYDSKKFQNIKEDTDVFFINLTPEVEEALPQRFAKFFHKDFIGVHLSKKKIYSLDRTFDLFFAEDLRDKTELNHTDNLFFLTNYSGIKTLKSIHFTHPLSTEKLIDAIIYEKKNPIQ